MNKDTLADFNYVNKYEASDIACGFYGQPRHLSANCRFHFDNLIAPNRADVFLHQWCPTESTPGWKSESLLSNSSYESRLRHLIQQRLKPVSFQIEPQELFLIDGQIEITEKNFNLLYPWWARANKSLEDFMSHIALANLSMWFSINRVLNQIRLSEVKRNKPYDLIFISRVDLSLDDPLKLIRYNVNEESSALYYPKLQDIYPWPADWFFWGQSKVVHALASIPYIQPLVRKSRIKAGKLWCNEDYIGFICEALGISPTPVLDLKFSWKYDI